MDLVLFEMNLDGTESWLVMFGKVVLSVNEMNFVVENFLLCCCEGIFLFYDVILIAMWVMDSCLV